MSAETILRGTIKRSIARNQRLQIGSEAALNTLDANLDSRYLAGGVWIPSEVLIR